MKRDQQIQILKSIAAGKLTIKQAVKTIRIAEEGYFNPLVGIDLVEYQEGNILQDIVIVDGIPGRVEIKSNLPEVEIYL